MIGVALALAVTASRDIGRSRVGCTSGEGDVRSVGGFFGYSVECLFAFKVVAYIL